MMAARYRPITWPCPRIQRNRRVFHLLHLCQLVTIHPAPHMSEPTNVLDPQDLTEAQRTHLRKHLSQVLKLAESGRGFLHLEREGEQERIALPPSYLRVLAGALAEVAEGRSVTLEPESRADHKRGRRLLKRITPLPQPASERAQDPAPQSRHPPPRAVPGPPRISPEDARGGRRRPARADRSGARARDWVRTIAT